jgi:hypothetical protein
MSNWFSSFGHRSRARCMTLAAAATLALAAAPVSAHAAMSYLSGFSTVTSVTSTVPPNGDVNPYGIVAVPRSVGALRRGNLLISNFNNSMNLQGTGTTIDQITRNGSVSVFAQLKPSTVMRTCPGGLGLSTALVALRSGFVIVGSLPTQDGMSATAQAGCLIVLNSAGNVVETLSGGPINGPWDMTAVDDGDFATLFVTNVLNGTVAGGGNTVNRGTVVRIGLRIRRRSMPRVVSTQVIGSGFAERTDPAALVLGPTGVALGQGRGHGILYVADTVNSRIAAIPDALHREHPLRGGGITVSSGHALNAPLGLTLAPNGDIITANGGDGNLVETRPSGRQVATSTVDSTGAGALFGLIARPTGVSFVDDADNTLRLLH